MNALVKTLFRSLAILGAALLLSAGVLLATGSRSASALGQRAGHSHAGGNGINLAGASEVAGHFLQISIVTAIGTGIIALTKRNKRFTRVSNARGQISNQVNHG